MADESQQAPQRPVDPYADLVGGPRKPQAADPYADLVAPPTSHRQANDPGGDVVLGGNADHETPPHRPLVPPVMAPRDVTAIPLTAHAAYRPSLPERAAAQVGQFASEAVHHPLTTALGLVKAPVASLLTSTGGALERGFTDPNAEPDRRAISDEDYTNANAQTLANTAFGPLEGAVASRAVSAGAGPVASKLLGLAVAGAPAGAAYSPNDPAAGAAAGSILAAVLGAAHEGVARGAPKLVDAAGKGARAAGRAVSGAAGKLADALPNLTDRADPYADLTKQRTEAAQLDQPPTLDEVNAAHADLTAQHAAATDPLVQGELASRLSMVEGMRRKLTGEPEPKVATAGDGVPPITEAPATPPPAEAETPLRGAQEPAGATKPSWLDENLAQYRDAARRAGLYPDIEQLSAERLTAAEIRARLADRMQGYDATDRLNIIRAVRGDLGIPSMDEGGAFEEWLSKRQPPAPASTPEAPSPYADLFGEKAPEKIEQGGLFGEQAGTEGSRPLANAERAARSELDQLRTKYEGTTDPAERQEIAARMGQLEKLTNRGEKIGAEELGRRAVAAGTEADPYGDLTGESKEPAAPKPPSVPDDWFAEPDVSEELASGKAGVVVDEDGERRFASARTPAGTRRPVPRVSTDGLLDELLDMEHRRANAQQGSIYELREDPNFHTSGIPQEVSTKPKGGGPSRQAKALTNLDAFKRAQAEIEAELATRGLAGDALTERLRDHHEVREERRALSGDFDSGNMRRDQVRDETGKPLFAQTPEGFAEEERERQARGEQPPAPPRERPGIELGGIRGAATVGSASRFLRETAVKLAAYKDAVQRVFAPASRSEEAGTIALSIRAHEGEFARQNEMARELLKQYEGAFNRMPDEERLAFIDAIEQGRPQSDPQLQPAANTMRHLLDTGRKAIQQLGTGKLQQWIVNYFPHLWDRPEDAVTFIDRVMSKRSMSGPGTFLKQRSIPTLKEGIEAGLEPLTTNPIDMTLLKLREMNKYIAGQKILAELKEYGFAKYVSALEHPPTSLVKLDDKLGTIYGPPHVEVMEGFDKLVRQKLESVMQEMGVEHVRKPNIGGKGRLGYAEGDSRIVSRSATESVVLMHEIGHALDKRLNVWRRLTDIPGKTKEAVAARKQLHTELRDLADMRIEGENPDRITDGYKDYIRKRTEKIANAVHALVYMPERMDAVAPMVKERLTAILKSDPVAAKMLDVKPSLVLGTDTFKAPVGGLVIKGHWYVPESVARVVNNYLSPGLRGNPFYDLYRGVGNSMNQWQLGFSAFHLGFTSMDAAVSKTALAVEQLGAGRPFAALRSVAESPIAPFSNYLRGSKVLRAYLSPGLEGGEMADIVNALTEAGGRVRQDEFYGGGAVKQFREALSRGKKLRAARLSLSAITEASSKLVMEHIVPRQKLGVFADLARFELSKLPENATKEQVRAAFAHAWDSVDNRMGQLVYDNLFWDRVAKDLTMASVRSVGWNLGTIRELGGGIADLQAVPRRVTHRAFKAMHLPGDWQGASEPVGLSHRAAYVVALPLTVGLAGGIMNYLYTGEAPRELKDYFYPRTGRKNPDGTEERVQLPSYMRDVGDYARHPVQTLVNKLHPLAGTIREMLQNEDYYGHEIHNPDDPMVRQLAQEAHYIASQFEPFGIHNAREQLDRGQKGAALLNAVGITPAPRDETRTAADLRMSGELGRRAAGRLTPEEVDRQQERRSIVGAMRSHDATLPAKVQGAMQDGAMTPRDIKPMLKQSVLPPDALRFKQLPLAEAMRVFQLATPEEKQRYSPVLIEKMNQARKRGTMPPVLPPGLFSPQ